MGSRTRAFRLTTKGVLLLLLNETLASECQYSVYFKYVSKNLGSRPADLVIDLMMNDQLIEIPSC